MTHASRKAASARNRKPGPPEHKCACGGACESCRKEHGHGGGLHEHSTTTAAGHDFSRVPVHTADASPSLAQELTLGKGSGVIAGPTYESSGTCEVNRTESKCKLEEGYVMGPNNNECCTSPCTREHEMVHVRDLDACCRAFSRALKRPGADGPTLKERFKEWVEQARPVTECRAYTNDITCAQRLAQLKGCAPGRPAKSGALASGERAPTSEAAGIEEATAQDATAKEQWPGAPKAKAHTKELADCCLDIVWYEQAFRDEALAYCAEARGKAIPPCPFTTKSTP